MKKKNWQQMLANDGCWPVLLGSPPLRKVKYLDLKPGTRVTKIGAPGRNGKETSSNRVIEYDPPAIYAGRIILEFQNGDEHDYVAFKLDPESHKGDNVFQLFSPIEADLGNGVRDELILQNFKALSILIYKAVFETN